VSVIEDIQTTDRDRAGFAWAQSVIGGTMVHRELQSRWRRQWFLHFDTGAGEPVRVVMRGFRNPGYCDPDDSGVRARLEQEAGVLRALNDVPVRTPTFYGHDLENAWTLMEFVDGEVQLTDEPDSDKRFRIYTGYVEELAKLHAHPLEGLDLPDTLFRPRTCAEYRQHLIDEHLPFYRALSRKRAEPTMEIGLQWTLANPLPDERPIGLGFGDVGPNQFLYVGDKFNSFIDVEYARIADPLSEMGQMRSRDVTYHSGRMVEHLRHYGDVYEKLTGVSLSIPSLNYWTVAGPALWNVFTVAGAQQGDGRMIDLPFALAYEVQQKRCILEGLAEIHGVRLSCPEMPSEVDTSLSGVHDALVSQFEDYYLPRATDAMDRTVLRYTASMAQTLRRGNALLPELDRQNLEELSDVLGHRPASLAAGLFQLEEAIAADHMHDFDRRLNFLYRLEVRRDYLYQPMQTATQVSLSRPMSRFDA